MNQSIAFRQLFPLATTCHEQVHHDYRGHNVVCGVRTRTEGWLLVGSLVGVASKRQRHKHFFFFLVRSAMARPRRVQPRPTLGGKTARARTHTTPDAPQAHPTSALTRPRGIGETCSLGMEVLQQYELSSQHVAL